MLNIFETQLDYVANVSARKLTTIKCGGIIKNAYFPYDIPAFLKLLEMLSTEKRAYYILGGGSNTVFYDGEIESTVVCTQRLNNVSIEGNIVETDCGVMLPHLIQKMREHNLGGLEFLSGVPASVGGALAMNAGAFNKEIKDFLQSVTVAEIFNTPLGYTALVRDLDLEQIDFSYRKGVKGIVLKAKFKMENLDTEQSVQRSKFYLKQRSVRQPKGASCGSVFKNAQSPAGQLLDRAGLKGMKTGGVVISEKHANFFINTGNATTSDFLSLVELAEGVCLYKYGINLEREFELVK